MKKILYIVFVLSSLFLVGCGISVPNETDEGTGKILTGNNENAFNPNSNNMGETETIVAKKGDTVYVNYTGKTEDGKIFDTSVEEIAKEAGLYNDKRPYEPLTFELGAGQMIKGFDKGVEGMALGEKKTIAMLPEDGYGEIDPNNKTTFNKGAMIFGNQGIITEITEEGAVIDFNEEMAGKTLVFEITMVESDTYPVANGSNVKVDYTGTFPDGKVFDSSKKTGRTPLPFTVGIGQMIKGFDIAVVGMNKGDTKTITLEPKDAYGEANPEMILNLKIGDAIPQLGTLAEVDVENQTIVVDGNHFLAGKVLVFDVELVKIK